MKHTKQCPKCQSKDIIYIEGDVRAYGAGNNIQTGFTIFSSVKVNRYVCGQCGYSEEWINECDLQRLKDKYK